MENESMSSTNEMIVNLIERYHMLLRIRNANQNCRNIELEIELAKCKIELSTLGVNIESLDQYDKAN